MPQYPRNLLLVLNVLDNFKKNYIKQWFTYLIYCFKYKSKLDITLSALFTKSL